MSRDRTCSHLEMITDVEPEIHACQECMEMGDTWVHLRMCKTCGHVGCCDDSKNKHATRHFRQTNHPVIQSIEPGEHWMWCYIDHVIME